MVQQLPLPIPEMIQLQKPPALPLAERKNLPDAPALYFVLDGTNVLYIGKTISLRSRWGNHHQQEIRAQIAISRHTRWQLNILTLALNKTRKVLLEELIDEHLLNFHPEYFSTHPKPSQEETTHATS